MCQTETNAILFLNENIFTPIQSKYKDVLHANYSAKKYKLAI